MLWYAPGVRGALLLGMLIFAGGCTDRIVRLADDEGRNDGGSTTSAAKDETSSSSSSSPTDTQGFECRSSAECRGGDECFEGVCVGAGELRISLSWSYTSDLDLHVEIPTGVHISFENPAAGGGVLDVDDCVGSLCLDGDGTHVENIFFPGQPPAGEYRVWVDNFDGNGAGPFRIDVSGAVNVSFDGTLPASPVTSQVFAFSV